MIRLFSTIPFLLLIGLLTGCFRPVQHDYLSVQKLSLASDAPERDRLWEAIQETLRRNRFRLDRVDRQAGVITTMPEVSQHFFEFWRHDVSTWPDFWEATLNPIRRWVAVTVTHGDDGSWQDVQVVVHKERLSSPDRQFNSTGAAYQYFGDKLPSTTGLIRVTKEYDRWLDLGRDHALEDDLLRRILERAGMNAAS